MKTKFVRIGSLVVTLLALALLVTPKPALAAACTSLSSGNWNLATRWSCGVVPTSIDDVTIAAAHTITYDLASSTIQSLTTNATGALNFNAGSNDSLTVTGNATNGGTIAVIGAGGGNWVHTLNVGGNFANNGTFTTSTGGGGNDVLNVVLNGTAAQTISGSSTTTFNNLTLSNTAATVSATSSFNVAVTMTVNANATFSPGATVILNTGGAQGTITGSGTIQVTRIVATPDYNSQYVFSTNTLTNMTVDYAGLGNQTINVFTYGSLTTSGSGTKTLSIAPGTLQVNTAVTIGSGTILDESTKTMSLAGASLSVNGTLDFSSSTGLMQCTSGTCTLTMAAAGLIRTLDSGGLGPGASLSLVNNGGTWTTTSIDSSGTVEYYLTGSQTVSDRNYNNLIITNTGTKTWTLAATRTVNGNVTINSGAPLTLASGQTVNVLGNWTNNGTFTPGTTTISFNGTAAQTLNGSAPTTFPRLIINNSTGVTMTQNITVSTAITLTSGDLNTGAFTLTMATGATTTSTANDVVGNVLRSAPAVGSALSYGSQWTTIQFNTTAPSSMTVNLTKPITAPFQSGIKRQYTLTPSSPLTNTANIQFHVNLSDTVELNGNAPTTNPMVLYRFTGSTWANQGRTSSSNAGASSWVSLNAVTTFSPWGISSVNSPTAVRLSQFNARVVENRLALNWTTGSEINTAGFNLYRAESQGGPYTRLNAQLIAATNSVAGNSYQYEDATAVSGKTYYYQLEDVELNGKSTRQDPIALKAVDADTLNGGALPLALGVGLGTFALIAGGLFIGLKKASL